MTTANERTNARTHERTNERTSNFERTVGCVCWCVGRCVCRLFVRSFVCLSVVIVRHQPTPPPFNPTRPLLYHKVAASPAEQRRLQLWPYRTSCNNQTAAASKVSAMVMVGWAQTTFRMHNKVPMQDTVVLVKSCRCVLPGSRNN